MAAGLMAAPAQARDVRRLPPTGNWVLEYADDTCRLGRDFGSGDERITVFFEQFVPGDTFNLMFVGKSIKPRSSDHPIETTVRFGPNEEKTDNNGSLATTGGSLPALILSGGQRLAKLTKEEERAQHAANERDIPIELAPIGPDREKAATWLELGKAMRFDIVFETGPMDKPLGALRDCSWDTVKSWGLSIEEQKNLRRKAYPVKPSSSWFSPDDYPDSMVRRGHQGIVNFRVIVDASGSPLSCHVQSSTRPKEFDDVVCTQVMKRAKFHPALDAAGKPVKSFYRQTVRFFLEG